MATSMAADKTGWLGLTDAERDVFVLSTVLKVLLCPS